MPNYNVIVSISMESEVQVEAESEEDARVIACELGMCDYTHADYVTYTDPEVIELWEMDE